uniref:Uncharacterized protein n=1 Tax=Amphimedon queenslandica TaxID=400682 RepID=A0A1X7VPJ0_AMPQE
MKILLVVVIPIGWYITLLAKSILATTSLLRTRTLHGNLEFFFTQLPICELPVYTTFSLSVTTLLDCSSKD